MNNYLIVDSGLNFARELHRALTGNLQPDPAFLFNPPTGPMSEVHEIAKAINDRIDAKTVILINMEANFGVNLRQSHEIVDLAYWLRCKYGLENPIVFYGLQSISYLLRAVPGNFILVSPGCYHMRLPLSAEDLARIPTLEPLTSFNSLRPYLKPRINLGQTRHHYANYVGMVLMMLLAQQIWKKPTDLITSTNPLYKKLEEFLRSLDYPLMGSYFNLTIKPVGAPTPIRVECPATPGAILLIDDLADGWLPILSQMLFGSTDDQRMASLALHQSGHANQTLDFKKACAELTSYIGNQKPHLILLDLRLAGDEDETELENFAGYQLLKFIKNDAGYKGVPVLIVTASSNAENVKGLLNAGAEGVWTKPGIDEGLSAAGNLQRYEELIKLIKGMLEPDYAPLAYSTIRTTQSSMLRSTSMLLEIFC
ncbi:MAG: response regulator [Pyrinomonadaceae bacterium]